MLEVASSRNPPKRLRSSSSLRLSAVGIPRPQAGRMSKPNKRLEATVAREQEERNLKTVEALFAATGKGDWSTAESMLTEDFFVTKRS